MTELLYPSRRALLRSGLCLLAAPALVRYSSLMPVKAWAEPELQQFVVTAVAEGSFETEIFWQRVLSPDEVELCRESLKFLDRQAKEHVSIGDIITISGFYK